MAHRVFRLSISPERAPEVRRVIDFDGRATLHDVHLMIQSQLKLDNDHLYAFYLSGKYFDRASEYGIADDSAHDSSQAMLFRLGLSARKVFAYLFDFGDELRHTVKVVSVVDVDAPLEEPIVVESVGDAPAQYEHERDDQEPYELPEHLEEVAPLAEAVLSLSERLEVLLAEDDAKHEQAGEGAEEFAGPPPAIVSLFRELAQATLDLAAALEEDEEALDELDQWSGSRDLLPRMLGLPLGLVAAGELDLALAVARAYTFIAPQSCNGDIAIILAESGKHAEATAQLEANLAQYPDVFVTALKAGEAFEALGKPAEAEAAYRRAITLAEDREDHEEAVSQLAGFLEDTGRGDEIDELFDYQLPDEAEPPLAAPSGPSVGRNDPCPCGSGKKYKKCHGA